jgi:hypothetical protein
MSFSKYKSKDVLRAEYTIQKYSHLYREFKLGFRVQIRWKKDQIMYKAPYL